MAEAESDLCDCPSGVHEPRCELASMSLTKAGFVDAAEGGVRAALEAYKLLVRMGYTDEDATTMATEETRESATCFAGIGSCGGGGCKHG